MGKDNHDPKGYWNSSLRIVFGILVIWFTVSFGCSILLKEKLDQLSIGGAPFGFWMSQQGSIVCFVILLFAYNFLMNRLDHKHGYDVPDEEPEVQAKAETEAGETKA